MTLRELVMAMDEIADEREETTPVSSKIKFLIALHPVLAARINETCQITVDSM